MPVFFATYRPAPRSSVSRGWCMSATRCRFGTSRICFMSGASTSCTRQCGSGGTGAAGFRRCGPSVIVGGAVDKRETGRWMNDRAENSRQLFRRRERVMLRFRRMRSLQKFAVLHGSIHNHFNQERTLTSRQRFASQPCGSRIVTSPLFSSGVNSALPDQCRGRVGLPETILACRTAHFLSKI